MLLRLVVVAAIIGGIAIGALFIVDRAADETLPATTEAAPRATVEVVRTDLVETETFPATLRYRDPRTVAAAGPGIVTSLPEEGTVVERGGWLAEIDGAPVVLMYGDRPAWRALSTRATDGPDVLQLEENLAALGYDPDGELTIDDDFTTVTRDLVRDWQEDIGVDDSGVVDLGRVVFMPGPVRVGEHLAEVGATLGPGTPLLTVTGERREVVLDLEADRQDLATVGDAVTVEVPSGEILPGRIVDIGEVARTPPGGTEPVIEVVIVLDDDGSAGGTDEAPVDVELVAERAEGVLAVPVEALLALAEGGYALELVGEAGTRLVAVETGKFAGGLVEVIGDIESGAEVVVPG